MRVGKQKIFHVRSAEARKSNFQFIMVILEDKDQNSNQCFSLELDVLAFNVLSLNDFFKFISNEVIFRSFIEPDFVFARK